MQPFAVRARPRGLGLLGSRRILLGRLPSGIAFLHAPGTPSMKGLSVITSYLLTVLFCFVLSIILLVFHMYMN
jgi:hypothetical protein